MKSVLVKTIPGYEFYSDGAIWNERLQRFLKGSDYDGYNYVSINGKIEVRHRVIAFKFLPIPEEYKDIPIEKLDVHHEDGNGLNNAISNLRIVSRQKHREIHDSMPVYKYGLDGNFIVGYDSLIEASVKNKMNKRTIWDCCKGRIKTAYNFQWSFEKHERIPPVKPRYERSAEKKSKPIEMCAMDWGHEAYFSSSAECKRQTGISLGNIWMVCNGKRNYASTKDGKKHRFRYINKEPDRQNPSGSMLNKEKCVP